VVQLVVVHPLMVCVNDVMKMVEMMNSFRFFQRNPYKDKCRLQIGSTFIFKGYYCTVTQMLPDFFRYVIQENDRYCVMYYDQYLKTPSAAGRQLNR
jgi:hypothetical protein